MFVKLADKNVESLENLKKDMDQMMNEAIVNEEGIYDRTILSRRIIITGSSV